VNRIEAAAALPAMPPRRHGVRTTLALLGAIAVGLAAAQLPRIIIDAVPAPAPAPASCLPPTEFETLHIVVGQHQGRLVVDCMYVGSTGTYTRRKVRTQ
jgi:hypothetical protein